MKTNGYPYEIVLKLQIIPKILKFATEEISTSEDSIIEIAKPRIQRQNQVLYRPNNKKKGNSLTYIWQYLYLQIMMESISYSHRTRQQLVIH